jgi:nicotinate dehydrogenase subunit B
MSTAHGLSRRSFFQRLGGGIVMLVGLESGMVLAQDARRLYPEDFNAYLVIGENGRVTVFSGKIEMGQGVWTSQAQMLAEELGVELASVDMVLGDTDRCPWDMGTFGSLTTRMFGPALRAAGAQARLTLLSMAAARLGVPQERLLARNGVISVAGDPGRKISYAELSRGARIAQLVDRKAVLRAASEFSVMGASPPRLDGIAKVTGAAQYAADIRIAGMLYARLLRPPMHGAKLVSVDAAGAQAMPGVIVVKDGDLLAVLHADPEAASAALGRVKAQWQLPEAKPDNESIFDHIVGFAGSDQKTLVERGDPLAARAGAAQLFESTFRKGYVAHAPIEPHAALAEVRGGKLTVWASTQTPFPTRDLIAQRLKLRPQDVRVITPFVGGGFGGKSAGGQALEAARLARITGKPVQVAQTRAEEFFYDTFDPAAVVTIVSGIDRQGRISLWDSVVYAAGERGAAPFYDAANTRVKLVGRTSLGSEAGRASVHPFAVGPWRAPGANMNVFATESQIDMMARAARADPVEFRLRHVDARMRKVLQAAADAFAWKAAAAPSGRGYGVACSIDAGTCVATMAEVKVDTATGKVKVVRMVCAQDMGIVVNPTGAKMQIEGGLTMGLGYVFNEELRFRGGEILDRNFDSYRITRFSDAPRIEAVLVKNDELAPQGGGEPSITTTGAVVANAVFDATGARMLRLPMTPRRVLEALAAAPRA